jgi:hypothetical protein
VRDALSLIPGLTVTPVADRDEFLGYTPQRGRWLKKQWARTSTSTLPAFASESELNYSDPAHFAELRERGARLYCAAREAQRKQTAATRSMGEQVGFSVDVFGRRIDFGVIEPTVVFEDSQRFLSGDGAQAFEIPMRFGTKITPVRGIGLPGLPEVRYPVALVTGDSEVTNDSSYRRISTGSTLRCTPFPPRCTTVATGFHAHSKRHQTVTHADAILSSSTGLDARMHFPLFSVGILEVGLDLGMGFGLGQLDPVANDRVLQMSGVTPPSRSLRMSPPYDDGLWRYKGNTDTAWSFEAVTTDPTVLPFSLASTNPLLTRARENDDHHQSTKSRLGLDATLSGEAGADFGIIEVKLRAWGRLAGDIGLRHDLRDAVTLKPGLPNNLASGSIHKPEGVLTIAPSTNASANLSGGVDFHIELDLGWFGHWDDTIRLLDFGTTTLASYDSGLWPEANRVRLGTASMDGDPMKNPTVRSHLPGTAPFPALQTGGVDACLADNTDLPNPPPECAPGRDTGRPPQANVCAYANTLQVTGACADIERMVTVQARTPAQATCVRNLMRFVCQPVSLEQSYMGMRVVGHILDLRDTPENRDPSNPASMAYFGAQMAQCVNAFVPRTGVAATDHAAAEAWLTSHVGFATCNDTAGLIGPKDGLRPGGDPTMAPPVTAGTCR